jgi:phenylacetate-coenzyme A ligase PaaK-like adenylate-forming protein
VPLVHDASNVARFKAAERLDPRDFAGSLAAWLDTVGEIEPKALADLFRYANGDDALATELRHVLQNFLFQRTLDHARRTTQHYAAEPSYARWRRARDDAAPDLRDLPIIERADVATRTHDFIASDVTARSICHTSGTTGTPLDIYKSHEEVAFLQAFFSHLFAPIRRALPSLPLVLTFPNFHHGVAVPMPGIGMTFVGGVTDDTLISDARRQIDASYRIKGHDERISIISGLNHYLLLFTSYLLEQGVDPAGYRMAAINVTGGLLPSHWRSFLENAWQCRVNERFTLTEVIGGASRISGTDTFALDPQLIGETLDCDSGETLAEGVGMLALSNLYPFVQMQPLVRYKTGDLVRRIAHPNGFRFQFLGKIKNCISRDRNGRRQWVFFSARLIEILAELPDVNVYDWFSNLRSVSDRTLGSYPVIAVESAESEGRLSIRIAIELRYAPHCRAARVAELTGAILSGLRATPGTVLAQGLDAGDIALDIVFSGPGTLKAPPLIKV